MSLVFLDIDTPHIPVTVTMWKPLISQIDGEQMGIWSHVFAPGNCAGILQTGDILARVACWPAEIMDLVEFEANDNAIGAIWN